MSPAVPPLDDQDEESARSLLNDKREVHAAQRQRYEQYSVVVEEVAAGLGRGGPGRRGGGPAPAPAHGGGGQPGPRDPRSAVSGAACSPGGLAFTAGTYYEMSTTTHTERQPGRQRWTDDEPISRR